MKKLLISSLLLWSSLSLAAEKTYTLQLNSPKGFVGEVLEAGAKTQFTNGHDQIIRIIADPALPEGNRVTLPAGANPFEQELGAGETFITTFTVTGYYRIVLELADGTVGTGEFAVIGDEIVDVKIVGVAFAPKTLTVKPGTWIRWINTSRMVHTVTSDKALASNPNNAAVPTGVAPWHSGDLAPGGVFIKQLNVAGDYKYFCKPHERMGHLGQITVSAN